MEGIKSSREASARQLFEAKYNCAQSVLAAFKEDFGLEHETAFRIATPFGGGIGHSGHICGAVSGAIMVIGLALGTSVYDKTEIDVCYATVKEFLERYAETHGSLTCPGLLGLDIGKADDLAKAYDLNLFHTRCPEFVGNAVTIVEDLLGLES